jgi:hypothetical protein
VEVHHHGMEVHRRLPDGTWVFFIDHPFGADPCGPSRLRPAQSSSRQRQRFAAKCKVAAPKPRAHHDLRHAGSSVSALEELSAQA